MLTAYLEQLPSEFTPLSTGRDCAKGALDEAFHRQSVNHGDSGHRIVRGLCAQ